MRYLIIFYTVVSKTKEGYGSAVWTGENYPNRNEIQKSLAKEHGLVDEYVITNVVEITEQDYYDWIK